MKAVDFIRKFGWELSTECINLFYEPWSVKYQSKHVEPMRIIYSKQFASLEFVKDLSVYIGAYDFLESNKINPYVEFPIGLSIQVKQAIQLVEEVCSVNR